LVIYIVENEKSKVKPYCAGPSSLKKTEEEIEILKRNPKVWNVHSVLNVLHSLVDRSNINKQLEVYNSQGNPDYVTGDFGCHSLYKMLGCFSLVGLLRLHFLLGDFYQAIKVLENIELNKKSLYRSPPTIMLGKSSSLGNFIQLFSLGLPT
jgi:translation initiation factor 3 subunit L